MSAFLALFHLPFEELMWMTGQCVNYTTHYSQGKSEDTELFDNLPNLLDSVLGLCCELISIFPSLGCRKSAKNQGCSCCHPSVQYHKGWKGNMRAPFVISLGCRLRKLN